MYDWVTETAVLGSQDEVCPFMSIYNKNIFTKFQYIFKVSFKLLKFDFILHCKAQPGNFLNCSFTGGLFGHVSRKS